MGSRISAPGAAVALVLVLGGCRFDAAREHLRCDDDDECPTDAACVRGLCRDGARRTPSAPDAAEGAPPVDAFQKPPPPEPPPPAVRDAAVPEPPPSEPPPAPDAAAPPPDLAAPEPPPPDAAPPPPPVPDAQPPLPPQGCPPRAICVTPTDDGWFDSQDDQWVGLAPRLEVSQDERRGHETYLRFDFADVPPGQRRGMVRLSLHVESLDYDETPGSLQVEQVETDWTEVGDAFAARPPRNLEPVIDVSVDAARGLRSGTRLSIAVNGAIERVARAGSTIVAFRLDARETYDVRWSFRSKDIPAEAPFAGMPFLVFGAEE